MRLTKYGHACVRLDDGDRALVIDPGTFSEAEALSGATAVLVTHEHADHIDVGKLAARAINPAMGVFTNPALAADLGDEVTAVAAGDSLSAARFTVQAVGGEHAEIIDGLPGCPNLGFVVDGIYHPGDSLFVPDQRVETLLVPASGPWLKLREAIQPPPCHASATTVTDPSCSVRVTDRLPCSHEMSRPCRSRVRPFA